MDFFCTDDFMAEVFLLLLEQFSFSFLEALLSKIKLLKL